MDDKPYFGLAEPPLSTDLRVVAEAARSCQACHLWRHATQTVFGEGLSHAPLMFVGEQPGDQEDKQGHPFVGPAGRVLERAMAEARIDPSRVYVTNAVKHFKWTPKGNRRLHQRPLYREITACYPWLAREIEIVQPELVVCLGSTAAQALVDKNVKVTQVRGRVLPSPLGVPCFVTVHPSSILRARDEESRERDFAAFVGDLKAIEAELVRLRASVR